MIFPPKTKIVMIGDSITDCDRARPIGEGLFDALGRGYVSIVDSLLAVRYPSHRLRFVNMGVSGNTVRDIKARWQTDVLDLEPDWLSICIGINDVWRHFHSPNQPDWHVPLDEYADTLDALLHQTTPKLKGLILMTPFFIEPNYQEPMREMMDEYCTVIRKFADKYEAVLVDTQASFDNITKELHPMVLAWDRVHPTLTGHMVIARSFLEAIEFDWH